MNDEQKENVENDVNDTSSTENSNIGNDIKQETVNTFNEAKEKMKNINFKEEAEIGKGLFKKLITAPRDAINEIAHDQENNFFKTALLLVIIWAGIVLIKQIIYYINAKYIKFSAQNILTLIKVTIAPVLRILTLTAALYIVNKKSKKSFITTITTFTVAKLPVIVSSLFGFLTYISAKITDITNPISTWLSVLSTVLVYFAVKSLTDEEDDSKAFKSFIIIEGIFYIVYFALSFLGIYI